MKELLGKCIYAIIKEVWVGGKQTGIQAPLAE